MYIVLSMLLVALPPITSTTEAVVQLKSADKVAALANLKDACRGKYRRELRDKTQIETELLAAFKSGGDQVKKAVLDTSACFSPAAFRPLIQAALADEDETVIAYGAEVSARLEDPKLVEVLHAAMEPRKKSCLAADLSNSAADVCVWLTYAPGALLGSADPATRKLAGERAAEMIVAEHPKIREVAVETLAATRLPEFATYIAALLENERKFSKRNSKELVNRFREREQTLKKGQAPKN